MERGASIPWQDALQESIGESRLDPSALREFFRPLEDWLRTENLRTNELVGWTYGKRARLNIVYIYIRVIWSETSFKAGRAYRETRRGMYLWSLRGLVSEWEYI